MKWNKIFGNSVNQLIQNNIFKKIFGEWDENRTKNEPIQNK